MSALLLLLISNLALADISLTIKEINPNYRTKVVKSEIEKALELYHLEPFIFSDLIHIESNVTSHSHPVITINTKYFKHPHLILSVFLHEQLHHFSSKNLEKVKRFVEWTRHSYPVVPTYSEGGARSEYSTRLHLLICFLEYRVLSGLIGNELAKSEIKKFSHYQWIYQQVFNNTVRLETIVRDYDLILSPKGVVQ